MDSSIKEKENKLAVLTALTNRISYFNSLGKQYGTDRDIYEALGYPETIEYEDYRTRYDRQDIAGAIINRPVEATWRGNVGLLETNHVENSMLTKEWNKLMKDLKLKTTFIQLDKLSCIGQYAILILGFNDVQDVETGFAAPVQKSSSLKLIYVNACAEDAAVIDEYETDPNNPRYGLPLFYTISLSTGENTTKDVKMHYSRVLHVLNKSVDSKILGEPVLKRVWNRLMDLEKLTGGSAEMYWRGAYPGFSAKVDKDYTAPEGLAENLEEQIKLYEHNLTRMLVNEGVDIKSFSQQIASPKDAQDIQIQMISTETGIPKRILVGSERGELSSSQDQDSWLTLIQTRREEQANIQIIEPFVETLMLYGILPTAEEWQVDWSQLNVMGDKDRTNIGKVRAEALKTYTQTLASEVVPVNVFLKYFLGFTPEQIKEIEDQKEIDMKEEQKLMEEIENEDEDENNDKDENENEDVE